MAWRPAKSLVTLRNQLDASYPGWLFLGYLGDQNHANIASDHNPNAQGVVCALDIGPGGGLNIHTLADNIVANPHPNLKYIISNKRIAEWQNGFKWKPYIGKDPHDTHIHISVGRGPDGKSVQPYDDTIKWNIKGGTMATLVDDGNIDLLYVSVLHRHASQADKDARRGQDWLKAQTELYESKEWANQDAALKNPQTGNIAPGTYLKVNKSDIIEVK